jgi:hypothetical protein
MAVQQIMAAIGPSGDDPLWGNVVLLINGVGDSSDPIYDAKGHTLTNTGSVVLDDTDPDFPLGGIRISTGKYLYLPTAAEFNFSGDFTIEFDYKPYTKGSNYPAPLNAYQGFGVGSSWSFFDRHLGAPSDFVLNYGGVFPFLDTTAPGNNVKACWRLVRQGVGTNNLKLYKDDVLVDQRTETSAFQPHVGIWIGRAGHDADTYIDGLMGRIRLTAAARTAPQGTDPFPEG